MTLKQITSLIDDIYGLFGSGHVPSQQSLDDLGKAIANHVKNALEKRVERKTVRGSNIGTPCDRKLYYDVNSPEDSEPLEPWVLHKFLYGNILEEITFFLAQQAGHKVDHRGLEVEVDGVKGHIDGIIDGVLIDTKSASGYGMVKFKEHRLEQDDPFGYLGQIDFYKEGTKDVAEVSIRGTVGFLCIDKSNGQFVLDLYRRNETDAAKLLERVEHVKELVNSSDPPKRGYTDVPDGASGNRKLCTECSYCPYKYKCWGPLRKFIYSTGPRWFTVIKKEPFVNEDR